MDVRKKSLSIILSVSLVLSMFSGVSSLAAQSGTETEGDSGVKNSGQEFDSSYGRILHYSFKFDNQNATEIPDDSGCGKTGELQNSDQARIVDDTIYDKPVKALKMNGGSDGGYLQMPEGVLDNSSSVTISCWVKVNASSGYQRIWDIGNDTTSYLYLLTDGYNAGETGYATAITKGGWSQEQGVEMRDTLKTGQWIFTTVVLDGDNKTISLYKDGALIGTQKDLTADLGDLGSATNSYIGYGQFGNDPFNGEVTDFSIFNYAMSNTQVQSMCQIPDESRVEADQTALDLGDLSAITADLTLPAEGTYGSRISWVSSDKAVITDDGKVIRPAANSSNASVQLTATLTYGEKSSTKTFTATVLAYPSDQQIVDHDIAKINLGLLDCVISDLTLPTAGEWGSSITWKSSNPNVIADDGKVTRPAAGSAKTQVTLTVTAARNGKQASKEISVIVLPRYSYPSIKTVPEVKATTPAGTSPRLPDSIVVTYSDGTTGSVQVRWPDAVDASKYVSAGSFVIEGTIYDTDKTVQATVTVTSEDTGVAPQIKAIENDLSATDLTGNTILTQNRQRDLDYLLNLDNDRMLYNFRSAFRQDTKNAEALGGWDAPDGLLRGHSTGHYLSALALAYASTKSAADSKGKTENAELKTKMDDMVSELSKLQDMSKGTADSFKTKCSPSNAAQSKWSTDPATWGTGFLSAYSPDQFALLEQYTPYSTIWAPYYTYHKILAGMIDCYTYGGNQTALKVAKGMGDWVYTRLSKCTTADQRSKMWDMYIAGEYGGMNESLATLYQITKDTKYLDAAKMFDNTKFFNNLSKNVDDIRTRHANQHIPQIIGAVKEYTATGDRYYYNVASDFWDLVSARYAYSIGGVGKGEKFTEPYTQAESIDGDTNCETCAAYNMLKLTKDLYGYDPDNAKYMDYYERTLLNQIAGSQDQSADSNHVTYMMPLGPGQSKTYSDDYDSFTCCHGTGMENHVKYQEAAYYHSKDNSTLYVNLYMPTRMNWTEKGVTISQNTQFPSDFSTITVKGNASFTMKLRVPYWATKGYAVKVNGKTVVAAAEPSSYVSVQRDWRDGDTVEISMPFSLHLDKTPDKLDHATVASVLYGPIVMVGKTKDTSWKTLNLSPNISDSIEVDDKSANKDTVTLTANGLTLVPMYTAYNFAYDAYFKINSIGTDDSNANKSDLLGLYSANENKSESAYTSASWSTFATAMQNAKSVLDDVCATQDQIDQAVSALSKAENALVPIGSVNKTELQSLYDSCRSLTQGDYTDASWSSFTSALNQAKNVLADSNATQNAVNQAAAALRSAQNRLTTGSSNHHSDSDQEKDTSKPQTSDRNPSAEVPTGRDSFRSDTVGIYRFSSDQVCYYYKIITTDTIAPTAVSSNPTVAGVEFSQRLPDGYLFKITNLGVGEAVITTTAGDGTKTSFVVQGTGAGSGIASDTPYRRSIAKGKTYQFKFTVISGNAVPVFTIGDGRIVQLVSARRVGNTYYDTVAAVSGGSAGLYVVLPGRRGTRICIITVS